MGFVILLHVGDLFLCYELRARQYKMLMVKIFCPLKHYFFKDKALFL
jgi:hypothetical protein